MNAMRLTGSAPSLRQHTITAPVPAWRHPSHVVLETCVEDVEGVRISARAGADRAELGANLTAAGTTPSIGTIEAAIFAAAEQVEQRRAQAGAHWAEKPEAAAPFGLRILIRPRGGSFVYNADEGRAMIADVRRIATLAEQTACRVSVYGEERTLRAVEGAWQAERRSLSADFHKFTPAEGLAGVAARTRPDHMAVFVLARRGMPSYHRRLEDIPGQLERYFSARSWMLIVPAALGSSSSSADGRNALTLSDR